MNKSILKYWLFGLLAISLTFGLHVLYKTGGFQSGFQIFGITIHLSVVSKYIVGLLQWALILRLYNSVYELENVLNIISILLCLLIVVNAFAVWNIKTSSEPEDWETLHKVTYHPIKLTADGFVSLIALTIHLFLYGRMARS